MKQANNLQDKSLFDINYTKETTHSLKKEQKSLYNFVKRIDKKINDISNQMNLSINFNDRKIFHSKIEDLLENYQEGAI